MNSVLRLIAVSAAALTFGTAIASAQTYISDANHTTAIDLEYEASEINIDNTNSIAVTRDGVLLLSPGASAELTVNDGSDSISVLSPVNFDFEDSVTASEVAEFAQPQLSQTDSGQKYLSANANTPAVLSFNRTDINSGVLTLNFKLFKGNTDLTELINIKSVDGNDACRILLTKRNATAVYFSFMQADGTVKNERSITMNTGEWYSAKLVMDFANSKSVFYLGDTAILDNVALINTESGISTISFGTDIDDVAMSCGEAIDDCTLNIGINETVTASGDGVIMIDPLLGLEISGEIHEIDAKYCNFSAEGDGIFSAEGKIIADMSEDITQINIKASCIISGEEKQSEKTVAFVKDETGEVYPMPDAVVAFAPEFTEEGVNFKVYNGAAEKTLIAAVVDSEGNISVETLTAAALTKSEKLVEMANVSPQNTKLFLLDTLTVTNLLNN